MVGLKDRVIALLVSRPGDGLCGSCLARMLGVPHKSAHEAALKLEARPGFNRGYGQCSVCDKYRIVTVRRSEPPSNGQPPAEPTER